MLPTWLSGRSELEVSRHFSLAASGFAGRVLRNGSCGGADGPLSVADLGIFSIMEKLRVSSEEQLLWTTLPHWIVGKLVEKRRDVVERVFVHMQLEVGGSDLILDIPDLPQEKDQHVACAGTSPLADWQGAFLSRAERMRRIIVLGSRPHHCCWTTATSLSYVTYISKGWYYFLSPLALLFHHLFDHTKFDTPKRRDTTTAHHA